MNKNSFLRSTKICVALLALTMGFMSCNENTATAQSKTAVSSKLKVAPEMDIHVAVVAGNIEAVKQHIAAGTDLNEKDAMGGSSPLITACLFDRKEIAKLLIDAGANINFQNNDGSTPLHVAAFFCKPDMVQLLMENNASKTLKNKYNNTAYEIVTSPFSTVKSIYEQMKQILEPMGVKLDLPYIEKTRPVIAGMLK